MMLFANGPDFGTTGGMACCLLIAWALVLGCAARGFYWGCKFSDEDSPARTKARVGVVLLSGLIPLCCCMVPRELIRIEYGNYPLEADALHKVCEGMTKKQVLALLGTPYRKSDHDDPEIWYYLADSYGFGSYQVWFSLDDRVQRVRIAD